MFYIRAAYIKTVLVNSNFCTPNSHIIKLYFKLSKGGCYVTTKLGFVVVVLKVLKYVT